MARPAPRQPPSEDDPADVKQERLAYYQRVIEKVVELVRGIDRPAGGEPLVYSVSCNRRIESTVWRSTLAIKADAARNVFGLRCDQLTWAIVDTGVDARHPAFRKRYFNHERGRELPIPLPPDLAQGTGDDEKHPRHKEWKEKQKGKGPTARADWSDRTRVLASYDFSIIRYLLLPDDEIEALPDEVKQKVDQARTRLERGKKGQSSVSYRLRSGLKEGRELEWSVLERLIQVPHNRHYQPPAIDHGTHVAGILAADWRRSDAEEATDYPVESDVRGVCSDINVLDLRVFDSDGEGDEFTVLAAMQFLQSLNAHKDYQVVHGVNLSLSIRHDVANYACGRTPVCEEAERLVANGLVVVAAAGNDGHMKYMTAQGLREGYQGMSITDPGNAEGVITVGATHRDQPHTYGVSYFSSRGPTGDGRAKPDLVAPGEKISAPVLDADVKVKDGTSMAAPHVSGAAALLMARHLELAGQPRRIKEILCSSATDLGRERYFQGAGMLDILRAMQSV